MSIHELKIYLDLSPESKSKVLFKYAMEFDLGYLFVDSENGHCYLFDEHGEEKDVSMIYEINEYMIPKDIKKIVIPNYVVSIRDWTFENCSDLESVTIPNSITRIRNGVFFGCSKLKSVTILDSITSIDTYAFCECNKLTSMTIPDSVTSIGDFAFENCESLINVTIPNSVKNIESCVFRGCNLKSIVFKGKTIDQVKAMTYYPFGIEDESIIKAELN